MWTFNDIPYSECITRDLGAFSGDANYLTLMPFGVGCRVDGITALDGSDGLVSTRRVKSVGKGDLISYIIIIFSLLRVSRMGLPIELGL